MGSCSSSTPSSSSRSERRLAGSRAAGALAAVAATLIAGCGSSESAGEEAGPARLPEPSALVRIAVADDVETLDPVYARTRTEQLISRQIYEPLVSPINPPFAVGGSRRGPARPLRVEKQGALWRFELRPNVLFQDGSPLNAEAVIENFKRWVNTGVAAEILPELTAVDAPQPGQVRFQLSEPVPDLPRRLADPRLGLVSLEAIEAAGSGPLAAGPSGTGPYEYRERQGTRLLLVRSVDWWGTGVGLGPGINQLDFVFVDGGVARLDQLAAGDVRIADDLGPAAVRLLEHRPLLASVSDGRVTVGFSAAVRGLSTASPDQSLSELWLTELR